MVSELGTIDPVDNSYGERLNAAVGTELDRARRAAFKTIANIVEETGLSKSQVIRIQKGRVHIDMVEIALFSQAVGAEPIDIVRRAQSILANGA